MMRGIGCGGRCFEVEFGAPGSGGLIRGVNAEVATDGAQMDTDKRGG